MSDYLYNILARSFGLVETAQPRVTSIFEPPRAFRPVDALQDSAPTVEASVFDEDERTAPASPAKLQAVAPSRRAQPAATNITPGTDVPAVLSNTERPAAQRASLSADEAVQVVDEAIQVKEDALSPAASEIEPQRRSGRAPAPPLQPSIQRETRANAQPKQAPPASTRTDAPTVKSGAQPPAQTIHFPEQVMIERLAQVEENSAQASPGKQPQAEAQARSGEATRPLAKPEQRSPVRAQVAEQGIVERALERALSTESSTVLLQAEPPANPRLRSPSQRMKDAAPDNLPQPAAESLSPAETKTVVRQRQETVIVQPQVSRYVETERPDALQQTRAAEPEQVVQVTIGRIEVRAASQPPAQARAQHKSSHQPSQSLEEYLRQRAQGGGSR